MAQALLPKRPSQAVVDLAGVGRYLAGAVRAGETDPDDALDAILAWVDDPAALGPAAYLTADDATAVELLAEAAILRGSASN